MPGEATGADKHGIHTDVVGMVSGMFADPIFGGANEALLLVRCYGGLGLFDCLPVFYFDKGEALAAAGDEIYFAMGTGNAPANYPVSLGHQSKASKKFSPEAPTVALDAF